MHVVRGGKVTANDTRLRYGAPLRAHMHAAVVLAALRDDATNLMQPNVQAQGRAACGASLGAQC